MIVIYNSLYYIAIPQYYMQQLLSPYCIIWCKCTLVSNNASSNNNGVYKQILCSFFSPPQPTFLRTRIIMLPCHKKYVLKWVSSPVYNSMTVGVVCQYGSKGNALIGIVRWISLPFLKSVGTRQLIGHY